MKNSLITFTTIFIFVLAAGAFAQAPSTMPYQGRLADDAGNAITTEVDDVVFTIYDDTTSGANDLWTETDTLNCDENGVFTIELGLEVPIDPMIFNGEKRWLGIKVGTDDEMVPRQLLSSAPYSFSSASPGITYNVGDYTVDITGTNSALDSIELDITVPGYVYVFAMGDVYVNHTTSEKDELYFNVNDTAGQIIYGYSGFGWVSIPTTANAGTYVQTLNITRVFTETDPGHKKYYFNAFALTGSTNLDRVYAMHIGAIFFPTAIGVVEDPRATKGLPLTAPPEPATKPEMME